MQGLSNAIKVREEGICDRVLTASLSTSLTCSSLVPTGEYSSRDIDVPHAELLHTRNAWAECHAAGSKVRAKL